MKIKSRPSEEEGTPFGFGEHQLNLTEEQLTLVTALLCSCRLGKTIYGLAAFELITQIEDAFGDDFLSESADSVDPHVTVEDDRGLIVFKSQPGDHFITLEV